MTERRTEVSMGGGWIALVIFIIAFHGEPDLVDAAISGLESIATEACDD